MARILLIFLVLAAMLYVITKWRPPNGGNWRDDDDEDPPQGPRDPGKALDLPSGEPRPDRVREPTDTDA